MFALSCLVAAACGQLVVPGPVAVRAPSHDSAIIQSHRLGGNFAYSTHEAHAYAVQTPTIGTRTVPVGVSYHHGAPVVSTSTDFLTHHIPQYSYTAPEYKLHQIPTVHNVATSVPAVTGYAAHQVPVGVGYAGVGVHGAYGLPFAGAYAAGLPYPLINAKVE